MSRFSVFFIQLEDSEWAVPEVDSISEESTESTQPFDDLPEDNGTQDITPFVNLEESYGAVDVDDVFLGWTDFCTSNLRIL